MIDYVLAFLLFLGSATAIPLAEPARTADLAFIIAAALCARPAFGRRYPPGSPLPRIVNVLLGIMVGTLLSWLFQLLFGDEDTVQAGLATAIQIPGAIICALLIGLRFADDQVIERCGKISLVFSLCLLVMLALYLAGIVFSFLLIDYATTNRFSALSSNPNQLGLVLVPLPYFSYIAAKYGTKRNLVAAFEIVTILVVNYFSFGKTLFIAWILFFAPILMIELVRQGVWQRLLLIPAAIAALPFIVTGTITLFYDFYVGQGRGSIAGQGENRLSLWTNGLLAWLDSPLIGHGPGPFSGDTAPYQSMEAHNTLIDWLASYGLIGFATVLALYIITFRLAFARRNLLLIGLAAAIATQAFTQFYGRAPFYWLWWVLTVAISVRLGRLSWPTITWRVFRRRRRGDEAGPDGRLATNAGFSGG